MLFPQTYKWKPPASAQLNPYHRLNQGLVGYWRFVEGCGLKAFDYSGRGNHGTLTNGPTWTTGKALQFDGIDDYVDYESASDFDMAIGTISLWVKSDYSASQWQGLIGIYESEYTDYLNLYMRDNVGIYVRIEDDNVRKTDLTSSLKISDANWHQIVITQNGVLLSIYLDGVESSVTGTNSAYFTDHLTTWITKIGYSQGTYFNGTIDEVRIYNRAPSAQEIWQLHADPFCMFAQPMEAELFYVAGAPPVGAIMNQFQKANLGADLYDGVVIA
jgi:hypothetical protein